jgi:hypothetical protein
MLAMVLIFSIAAGCSSEKPEQAAKTEQTATESGQGGGPVLQCRERFAELDVDKDGKVTFEEFSAISHPGGQADVIFKARDKDADGVLVVEEFCQGRGAGAGKQ